MANAAPGGTISSYVSGGVKYIVHQFTTVGSSTFTLNVPILADFLLVGGGGGGNDGGGGAGGLVYASQYNLSAGSYTTIYECLF